MSMESLTSRRYCDKKKLHFQGAFFWENPKTDFAFFWRNPKTDHEFKVSTLEEITSD